MPKAARPRSEARISKGEKTRRAILTTAARLFAARGYDATGVREIGAATGVNPALINLYFGSKAGLFREIVSDAFSGGELLQGEVGDLGALWAHFTVKGVSVKQKRLQASNQALQLMIRSASSPTASRTVRQAIDEQIVAPIAARLAGRNKKERASLVATYLLGFALMQRVIGIEALSDGDQDVLIKHLARATQDCLDS
jgi:AcrR family transcriptional regulator